MRKLLSSASSGGGGGGPKKPKAGKRGGKRGGKGGSKAKKSPATEKGAESVDWRQDLLAHLQSSIATVVAQVRQFGDPLVVQLGELQERCRVEEVERVVCGSDGGVGGEFSQWSQQLWTHCPVRASCLERLATGQRRSVAQFLRLTADIVQELRTIRLLP